MKKPQLFQREIIIEIKLSWSNQPFQTWMSSQDVNLIVNPSYLQKLKIRMILVLETCFVWQHVWSRHLMAQGQLLLVFIILMKWVNYLMEQSIGFTTLLLRPVLILMIHSHCLRCWREMISKNLLYLWSKKFKTMKIVTIGKCSKGVICQQKLRPFSAYGHSILSAFRTVELININLVWMLMEECRNGELTTGRLMLL